MILVRRNGFSKAAEESEAITWPRGWAWPQRGDRVILLPDFGGYVETIEWDPANWTVRCILR